MSSSAIAVVAVSRLDTSQDGMKSEKSQYQIQKSQYNFVAVNKAVILFSAATERKGEE